MKARISPAQIASSASSFIGDTENHGRAACRPCPGTRRHHRQRSYIISCIVPSTVCGQHKSTRLELRCAAVE